MVLEDWQTEVLSEMREILSSKEKWTQGANARNAEGEPVEFFCLDASSFCLIGAYHLAVDRVEAAGIRRPLVLHSAQCSTSRTGARAYRLERCSGENL